jgi:hypothetical protein
MILYTLYTLRMINTYVLIILILIYFWKKEKINQILKIYLMVYGKFKKLKLFKKIKIFKKPLKPIKVIISINKRLLQEKKVYIQMLTH